MSFSQLVHWLLIPTTVTGIVIEAMDDLNISIAIMDTVITMQIAGAATVTADPAAISNGIKPTCPSRCSSDCHHLWRHFTCYSTMDVDTGTMGVNGVGSVNMEMQLEPTSVTNLFNPTLGWCLHHPGRKYIINNEKYILQIKVHSVNDYLRTV